MSRLAEVRPGESTQSREECDTLERIVCDS